MTIAADNMKDAPAWATRFEIPEGEVTGWFERDLTKPVTITTANGSGHGQARLVLDGGKVHASDGFTDESWTSPSDMRMLAAHLLNAVDAWDKLREEALFASIAENLTRCMTAADVDVAGLADRTEIPAARIEGILDGTVEINTTELVMFAIALDVQASEIMTTTRDV